MEIKDYEKKLDQELLPSIKEQLLCAYADGYQQATIDNYMRKHHVSGRLVDFGLPSKTIWIVRMESLTFRDAQKLGLQFPTEEQIEELLKCKWRQEQYDGWHCHVRGPNGCEMGIFDSCHQKLCVWTNGSKEDDNFIVTGYVYDGKENTLTKGSVYSGDKYSTLFVLPSDLAI